MRVARRPKAGFLSVQHEPAGKIRMHAGDDLHQRAFPRAVLADETMDLAGGQREVDTTKRLDAAEGLRDVVQFEDGLLSPGHAGQVRKCSSIHCMPAALAFVTTGPSVITCFGMPCPLFSPAVTAATPAMMAPPWMRQEGLRPVANMRPSLTAWIAGGMASTPPIRMLVRLRAFMML